MNFVSNFFSSPINQPSSVVVVAKLLYSTSAELFNIVYCFLDFHKINDFSILTAYLITTFLVRGHASQSASQFAEIVLYILLYNNIPCTGFFLMYHTILKATSMWDFLGCWRNWLKVCTLKEMFGLVMFKYSNFPINF